MSLQPFGIPIVAEEFGESFELKDCNGTPLGEIYDSDDAKYVVHLINMHGTLVEALKALLEYVNPPRPPRYPTLDELETMMRTPSPAVTLTPDGKVINVECIDRARQAIAKAEGR